MSPPVFARFRSVVERARRPRRTSKAAITPPPQDAIWRRIPTNVLVGILAECGLYDIYSLVLTCRVLHRRISKHESAIAREYLHRRQRQQKNQRQHEFSNNNIDIPISPLSQGSTLSPGDDLTFISDLFPPPPPQYGNESNVGGDSPGYSLGYLADLARCWKTCIRLSYLLAEHVVRRHLETDHVAKTLWGSAKTEREFVYSKGVDQLQGRILLPIAYLIFFLETYASITAGPTDKKESASRQKHSLQTQQSILRRPPFTNPHILLSTHHTMTALCTTVRHLMAPDIPYTSTENWLSLLLTTSTLERIVEFFTAVADDQAQDEIQLANRGQRQSWSRRLEFMWRMREDWEEFLAGVGESDVERIEAMRRMSLREVWFEAAEMEIEERGLNAHVCEDRVVVLQGSVVRLRCGECYEE